MRSSIILLLFFGLLFLSPLQSPAQTSPGTRQLRLHEVVRIYIGDMGAGDAAARFRLLLEEQLVRKNFVVVDNEDRADALLVGVLSLPPLDESEGNARVTVQLRAHEGDRLWSGNFGPRLTSVFRMKDPLQMRAEELARRLRADWEKSAQSAGAKRKS
ncbi:MAG TPA: hypothetical protein VGB73_14400 [Pyrinomonadaceae bacterium]|jgi:hypothetical protein